MENGDQGAFSSRHRARPTLRQLPRQSGLPRAFLSKLNLAEVAPRGELSSIGFCLAQTPGVGAEYLVYAPDEGSFTLDLSAMPSSRSLAVERFDPADGKTITQSSVPAGSSDQPFRAPFRGDAVLCAVDVAGHN